MIKCPSCNQENTDNSKFCSHCGYSFAGTQTGKLNPDTVLEGRYVVLKTIGQGGMGAVYMALDTRLNNRPVAIKEMSTRAVGGDLQAAIASFQKEASLLISLRHSSLPVIHDFFSRGEDRWYLVMDYIEGHTLKAEVQNRTVIPEPEVVNWAVQLCNILDYLHKRNPPVIFRDLKPDNIMLTPEGQIKLIDFGIARHFQQGNTSDTAAYGSSGFAPPEQYGQNQTDSRSDIYALGATLHFLLTGIDPAPNPFNFETPSKYVQVSTELEKAVMQALQFNVENRPQSIELFKTLLPQRMIETTVRQDRMPPQTEPLRNETIISTLNEAATTPLNINDIQSVTVPASMMQNESKNQSVVNDQHGLPINPAVNTANIPRASNVNWMAVTIILTLLLLIGGGGFWFIRSQNEQANEQTTSADQLKTSQAESSNSTEKTEKSTLTENNNQSDQQTLNQNQKDDVQLQYNLAELSKGEQIANQYDTIRVNLIKMLNNLAAGQGSLYDFYNTCDSATAERQALLNEAQSLQINSYNPALHNELVNMLNYALEYCAVCRQGADAISQSDNYGLNEKLKQAQACSVKIQKSLDAYKAAINQERNRQKAAT